MRKEFAKQRSHGSSIARNDLVAIGGRGSIELDKKTNGRTCPVWKITNLPNYSITKSQWCKSHMAQPATNRPPMAMAKQ